MTSLTRRAYVSTEAFVVTYRLYQPARLALLLIGIMALRALVDEIWRAFSGADSSMFFDPNDRYADFIKVALSYRDVFQNTIAHGDYLHHWPQIFRSYLLDNPYDLSPGNMRAAVGDANITNLHLPPLATLIYLSCSYLIAATNPVVAMLMYWGIYLSGGWTASRMAGHLLTLPVAVRRFIVFAFCASFPALWLLNRGNLAAGYSALLAFLYLITAFSGRWRWFGWLALALAVNLRPEPALLALVELCGAGGIRAKITRLMLPGVFTAAIAALAFPVAHALYPLYTLENVQRGLAIYHNRYILSDMGDEWNSSIFMYSKSVLLLMGYRGGYSAGVALVFEILCLAAMTLLAWSAWARRVGRLELVFVASILPAIFVPVYSYYHFIAFAGVLSLIVADLNRTPPEPGDRRLPLLIVTALVMSPVAGSISNGLLDCLMLLSGALFVLLPLARDLTAGAPTIVDAPSTHI